MMRIMRKAKGSISIFLLLVLMPMVTYATLIIDVSRIQSAKTLIMGAGDLSMNAGMSEYELALQNMYGLFAQVSSEDELESALKQYFVETVTGAVKSTGGNPDSEDAQYIQDWADMLATYLTQTGDVNDEDIVNFLEMQVDNYSAKAVDGTALANPAIMKKQIIDYMKYKGPVSIASNLADKLSFFGGAAKQTAALEKKVEYTEELDKMNQPCHDAYVAIMGTEEKKSKDELMSDDLLTADTMGYYQCINRYNLSLAGLEFDGSNSDYRFDQVVNIVRKDYKHQSMINIAVNKNPIPADKRWKLSKWRSESESTLTNLKSSTGYNDFEGKDDTILKNAFDKMKKGKEVSEKIVKTSHSDADGELEKLIGDLWVDSSAVKRDSSAIDAEESNPTESNFNKKAAKMTIDPSLYETESGSTTIINIDQDKYDPISTAVQERYNEQKSYAESMNPASGSNDKLFKLVAYSRLYKDISEKYNSLYTTVGSYLEDYKNALEPLAKDKAIEDFTNSIINADSEHVPARLGETVTKTNQRKEIQKDTNGNDVEVIITEEITMDVELDFYNRYYEADSGDRGGIKQGFINDYKDKYWGKLSDGEHEDWFTKAGNDLSGRDGITKGTNYADYKGFKSEYDNDDNFKKNSEAAKKIGEYVATSYVGENDGCNSIFEKYINAMYGDGVLPDIANYYNRHGWACLYYTYYFVFRSITALDNVYNQLTAVITQAEFAEQKKREWSGTVNEIPDEATKANMNADIETTTDGLDINEIKALRSLGEDCKAHLQAIKDKFDEFKYCGVRLFNSHTGLHITEKTLKEFVDKVVKGDVDALINGWFNTQMKFISNSAFQTVDVNDQLIQVAEEFNKTKFCTNQLTDELKTLVSTDVGGGNAYGGWVTDLNAVDYYDDSPFDNEKFFITLDNIVHPQKTKLDDDSQKSLDTVKEVSKVEDGKADINKAGESNGAEEPASGGEPAGGGEEPAGGGEEPAEKVKFEDGDTDTLATIKAYSSSRLTDSGGSINVSQVDGVEVNTAEGADYSGSASSGKSSLSTCTSLFTSIGEIAGNFFTDARDCIYMEEYFTEMFTCQVDPHLIEKDEDSWVLLSGIDASEINKNTEWFGKEVEYLLWGDKNIDANITKTNIMLFTIRFALNAIYAFTASDIQAFATSVATAIAGWCVIGVPIVKVCITLAIAAAESAYDLEELTQGREVPIYKNQSTFVCSPTGLLKTVAVKVTTEAIKTVSTFAEEKLNEGIDYVSQKFDEGVDGAEEEAEKVVQSYLVTMEEDVITGIENRIATPVINCVSDIVAKCQANEAKIDEYIDEALNKAFDQIRNDFTQLQNNSENDSMIAEYGLQVINSSDFNIKENLKTTLHEYVYKIIHNETISSSDNLRVKLVGKCYNESKYQHLDDDQKATLQATQTDPEDGVVTKAVDNVRNAIQGKVDDMAGNIASKIKEAKDNGVKNIKQYAHDEIDKATKSLTANATKAVEGQMDNAISKFASSATTKSVDSSSSGSINMGYKEYCKIFVLLQLIAGGETSMLQRAGVLMQYNVQNCGEDNNQNSDFSLTKANTLMYVSADVKIGTIMPWPFMVNSNEVTGSSGVEPDLSHPANSYVTIHYEGYNGY